MDYIIEISSDGDYGVTNFEGSDYTIEQVFDVVKANKFKLTYFNQEEEYDSFWARFNYSAENIDQDLFNHVIEDEWIDYDAGKHRNFYLIRGK